MEFVENLTQQEYTDFWASTPNNHFMQSYEWGICCQKNRHQIPYYVGLKDNGKIVAAALLLKKKTPLNMCYFYSPRGFTMDYKKTEILKEFTKHLKDFLKKENAIYLKLDPPIKYQTIDLDGTKIEGENNYQLFNEFINLNYHHCGFNKLYEHNQPRYTFRTYFNKYKDLTEIEKNISKSYLRNIKRSYNYELKIDLSNDIKTFHDLIKINSNKDGFHEYSYSYYQNIYDEFSKVKNIKIFTASINPKKLIKKFEEQLNIEKNNERINKLNKDLEYFKNLQNKKEHIIASLICTYSKTGAWSLYIGNDHTAEITGTINRLYYEFIKDAYENKYDYADLFGTVGDPKTKFKNLAGIFEHKRMLGGEYIEFIGEFDLINKPIWYKILPILLKIYRKVKK